MRVKSLKDFRRSEKLDDLTVEELVKQLDRENTAQAGEFIIPDAYVDGCNDGPCVSCVCNLYVDVDKDTRTKKIEYETSKN